MPIMSSGTCAVRRSWMYHTEALQREGKEGKLSGCPDPGLWLVVFLWAGAAARAVRLALEQTLCGNGLKKRVLSLFPPEKTAFPSLFLPSLVK